MNYTIKKTPVTGLNIDSPEWGLAEAGKIDKINWGEPTYCPDTEFRVLKGEDGLYVRFETDEEEIIAECKNLNDKVFQESCVEFFFRPDPEDPRYFNFEVNAIGTPLIGLGTGRSPQRECLDIPDISIFKFESQKKDKGFILKFFIPFDFIKLYFDNIGEYFLGNFQKCKELGNTPHYVTYYPITTEKPDFHAPQCFQKIMIEN